MSPLRFLHTSTPRTIRTSRNSQATSPDLVSQSSMPSYGAFGCRYVLHYYLFGRRDIEITKQSASPYFTHLVKNSPPHTRFFFWDPLQLCWGGIRCPSCEGPNDADTSPRRPRSSRFTPGLKHRGIAGILGTHPGAVRVRIPPNFFFAC